MEHISAVPETLLEAVNYFADPDRCLTFLVAHRWPEGNVACPQCGSTDVTFLSNQRRWKCRTKHPRQQFSIKVGTIFEDSPIGLEKWLPALWMLVNDKNGISSYEVARGLGVTQKTGWFMLHRLRLALHRGTIDKLSGEVEVDETYIGGSARHMHKSRIKKLKGTGTPGMVGKIAVMGLLQRHGPDGHSRVRLKIVPGTRTATLDAEVRRNVEAGSDVYTDALASYRKLDTEYIHNVIDHAESYVRGNVHTNGLENFWSLLKRALKGTYVSVEPFHLFRYLDEQAYRFNARGGTDASRFMAALRTIVGRRLTYKGLMGELATT
jgi:transposase-like protein